MFLIYFLLGVGGVFWEFEGFLSLLGGGAVFSGFGLRAGLFLFVLMNFILYGVGWGGV